MIVGVMASAVGGYEWTQTVREQNQQSFRSSSESVSQIVEVDLQRDEDLLATAGTLVSADPTIGSSQFDQWFGNLNVSERYPGTLGFAYIEKVPTAQLSQFVSGATADPPLGLPLSGPFQLIPPGVREQYCLVKLMVVQIPPHLLPSNGSMTPNTTDLRELANPGFDQCQSVNSNLLSQAQTSGDPAVGSISALVSGATGKDEGFISTLHSLLGQVQPFEVVEPVFAPGADPTTPSQREADLRGWVSGVFDSQLILSPALQGQRNMAIQLGFKTTTSPAAVAAPKATSSDGSKSSGKAGSGKAGSSGSRSSGAGISVNVRVDDGSTTGGRSELTQVSVEQRGSLSKTQDFSALISLHSDSGWVLRVKAPENPTVPTGPEQGIGAFLCGSLVSLLLFLLFRSVHRSRTQAKDAVEEVHREVHHNAMHDGLTGLPNRTLVLDRAEQVLVRVRRGGNRIAMLFVDLDGFKDINDTLGHSTGDHLLQMVADRFSGVLRAADTVARLGGDEFLVLATGSSAVSPDKVAQQLLDTFDEPFPVAGRPGLGVQVTASIGIASGARSSAEELLRDADIALREAKNSGKNRWVTFEPHMRVAVRKRTDFEKDLKLALEAHQFFLVYQPIYELGPMQATEVEALIRWRHPSRGVVSPMKFVPMLEETGLVVEVGKFVLQEACRQTRAWHDMGHRINVSVNVSAVQFDSEELVEDVQRALTSSGLPPEYVVIEITETALMRDANSVARRLQELKEVGVYIAIDDFGTGYSSLAYLQQFPVDEIKIDRAFVSGMNRSPEGAALVHALVQLGQALNLRTLAEGIEDQHQLTLLRDEQCDRGQGFYLARPLPALDIPRFLDRSAQTYPPGTDAIGSHLARPRS
jgi:diguanylate cyclase (GGDEF)-like protein